jgi:hypothetical protein
VLKNSRRDDLVLIAIFHVGDGWKTKYRFFVIQISVATKTFSMATENVQRLVRLANVVEMNTVIYEETRKLINKLEF